MTLRECKKPKIAVVREILNYGAILPTVERSLRRGQ